MSSTDIDSVLYIYISEFSCSTCKKNFKKQRELLSHLTIVKKYNISRENLNSLSKTNNKKFKSILVYLIHRKLLNGFRRGGHQLVSIACTENQFFDIFKGHIHYRSSRNVYRCIFQGTVRYQILDDILNNPL